MPATPPSPGALVCLHMPEALRLPAPTQTSTTGAESHDNLVSECRTVRCRPFSGLLAFSPSRPFTLLPFDPSPRMPAFVLGVPFAVAALACPRSR